VRNAQRPEEKLKKERGRLVQGEAETQKQTLSNRSEMGGKIDSGEVRKTRVTVLARLGGRGES